MAQTLELQLFGLPQITLAGEPIQALLANKARAMLFYLAVNGQTYTRDNVVALLWPEAAEEQGRRNLRELLFATRKWLSPYLTITRHTIAFNQASAYRLDVQLFRQGLRCSNPEPNIALLKETIELYRGEFLQGFTVREAASFEEWLNTQRKQLSELMAQALETLADYYLLQADYTAGLGSTQRLLTLEPWRESAHRQQMLLLARSGQRSAALTQYAVCQRILQEEYDAPPSAETVALYERIRSDRLEENNKVSPVVLLPQTDAQPTAQSPQTDWVNWNAVPNLGRFYGRRQELDLLHRWVNQEEQRLIALFGLTGQGKSALAATFVRELAAQKEGKPIKGRRVGPVAALKELGARGIGQEAQQKTEVRFERMLWRSVKEAPSLAELVKSWLVALTNQPWASLPNYVDAQIDCLIDILRQRPCLLILDQVDALMQGGRRAGCYRAEYTPYADLFRRIAEQPHRSCLLLISRERPIDFARLEAQTTGLKVLALAGLTSHESRELLQGQQLTAPVEAITNLVWRYSGHPLALTQVATLLRELFAGDLTTFLQTQAFIFDELRELLDQQFERLLPLEQELLYLLATERRPVTMEEMWSRKLKTIPQRAGNTGDNLEAVRSLLRRGLLEQRSDGFALPTLLSTYLTTCQPPIVGEDLSAFSFNLLPFQSALPLPIVS
ncbi:MAG: BTAD domain-containing putative transcriptional regulator [Caldilineaceae bacterium]